MDQNSNTPILSTPMTSSQPKNNNGLKIATTNNQTTTVTITDTLKVKGGPYIEDSYFYVPEWGLKFSIPSDLANYGYSVNYNSALSGTKPPK